jgi:xylulokinase
MSTTPRRATLGIDIGTSGTKVLAVDAGGTVLAERSSRREGAAGLSEHRPEQDWWAPVVQLVREILAELRLDVVGVGVTGCGPNVALTASSGTDPRPAIMYSDARAATQRERLEQVLGDERIQALCGHSLNAESVGPKLLWLQDERPDEWAAAREVHTSHSYLVRRLGGDYVLDHTTASLWDPFYDPWRHEWHRDLAAEHGVDAVLPQLAWPDEIAGHVSASAADATGIPAGTPIVVGTIDFAAELVGSGVEGTGQASIVYGSTMVVQAVVPEVVVGREAYSCVGPSRGTHVVGGVTATAGTLVAWWRKLLGDAPLDALESEAASSPIGANGLLLLPYFAGERSPLFDSQARGVLAGLTLAHTRGDIYRAVLEGTALAVRHVIDEIGGSGTPITRAVATGGGADSLWAQIVSDCAPVTQTVPEVVAAAALGAAALATRATAQVPNPGSWVRSIREISPNEAATRRYDELFPLYRRLDEATRAVSHALGTSSATLPSS